MPARKNPPSHGRDQRRGRPQEIDRQEGRRDGRHQGRAPPQDRRRGRVRPGDRRVAGQGQDDQQVPRLQLPGAGQLRPRPRPAPPPPARARTSPASTSKGWVPTYVVEDKDDESKGGKAAVPPQDAQGDPRRTESARPPRPSHVYLATDPDREGEAIAWHIEDELKLDDDRTFRITFNEITRTAVQQALGHPGKIDTDLVSAQEARRILDRVVGYPLSNLLGQKVTRGLSAGRVQSVAVRLIVDREREIEAFKTEEYWKITALLAPQGTVQIAPKPFAVTLREEEGARRSQRTARTGDGRSREAASGPAARGHVPRRTGRVERDEVRRGGRGPGPRHRRRARPGRLHRPQDRAEGPGRRRPPPPFTTIDAAAAGQPPAALHRQPDDADGPEALRRRRARRRGLRSPSSPTCVPTARASPTTRCRPSAATSRRTYGDRYLPAKPNSLRVAARAPRRPTRRSARPTWRSRRSGRTSLGLHGDQLRLYTLIYNRFVASQMTPAIFAVTNVEVKAKPVADATGSDGPVQGPGPDPEVRRLPPRAAPGSKQEDAAAADPDARASRWTGST